MLAFVQHLNARKKASVHFKYICLLFISDLKKLILTL